MAKARLYKFENGKWGVQVKRFLFWHFLTEPDLIGDDVCQTSGMKMVFQREDKNKALEKRNQINDAGPDRY